MARKKTTASIEAEIKKIQTEMSGLQEEKRRRTSEEIMDAFEKSGKSYQELMTFLKP